MAILTDFKRRTITLTQPVVEVEKMSNAVFRSTSKKTRFIKEDKLRPKVSLTHIFLNQLKKKRKVVWGGHVWKVIVMPRGAGGFIQPVRKPKKLKMGKVKAHFKRSSYQGYTQTQIHKSPFKVK
jgi:hypothetical protein